MSEATARWAAQLAAWAIPDEILAAVADSPWTLPTDVFARRADATVARPAGVSYELALAALDPPGSVLDVGAGAGAASLPLSARTTHLIAVDTNATMLEALRERAGHLNLPVSTVVGRWPDIADDVPVAEVVVCHHVAYNVPDLGPFAEALDRHARRRVVVEVTPTHPLHPLNPLWQRMHGLVRPDGPTAEDALAVLRDAGIDAGLRRWPRPPRPEYASFAELVATTRRRMCLSADRDAELAEALIESGVDPEHPRDLAGSAQELVTLWWDR